MSTSVPPTSEPESTFVCDCEEQMRSACAGEPFYKEHEGKRYCVLHFPGKEKSADFEKALQRKLENKDFNFHGVWFPDELSFSKFDFTGDVDFRDATFSSVADFSDATFSADAYFRSATFSAEAYFSDATFSAEADFISATFSAEVDFRSATFSGAADFRSATFRAVAYFRSATFSAVAYFRSATFSAAAYFRSATFSTAADFSDATFADAYFSSATFADHVRFAGAEKHQVFTDTSSLDLKFARIEKPDHVSFHTLSLRPHWFVNVDARKFDFTNVDWDRRSINEEIRSLEDKNVSSPHRLLGIACRHLAVNAEENHRYEEASRFRYMAMDARPRERWRGLALRRLSWWYWLASGYGERVLQASLVLLGIWLLSALLYNHAGFAQWEPKLASESDFIDAKRDVVGAPLKFSRALTYSAGVMTLQKPEPRPATTAAQTVVLLETILGPVQAALLALAIRRKFMR
jgi:uncharacterized protein YjbI with pentapeptide repeats